MNVLDIIRLLFADLLIMVTIAKSMFDIRDVF